MQPTIRELALDDELRDLRRQLETALADLERSQGQTSSPKPTDYTGWRELILANRSSLLQTLFTLASSQRTSEEHRVRAATMYLQNTAEIARIDRAQHAPTRRRKPRPMSKHESPPPIAADSKRPGRRKASPSKTTKTSARRAQPRSAASSASFTGSTPRPARPRPSAKSKTSR